MVTFIYPNSNRQVVFLRYCAHWMVQRFSEIPLVRQWDQPLHGHADHFVAPQWFDIACPYWWLQFPLLPHKGRSVRGTTNACPSPCITQVLLYYDGYWELQGCVLQKSFQEITMTAEGTVSYIDLIFIMVANNVAEECSFESKWWKTLLLYISILHTICVLVDTYLHIMNGFVLSRLGQHVSAAIPLTHISTFQVLVLELFYNPQI